MSDHRGTAAIIRMAAVPLLAGVLLLAGCFGAPSATESESQSAPSGSPGVEAGATCFVRGADPGVNGQAANLALPIPDVQVEFLQFEIAILRGKGGCADALSYAPGIGRSCTTVTKERGPAMDIMLWGETDVLTAAMFSSGADRFLSEMVTGYTGHGDSTFTYRMSVWRYPSEVALDQTPLGERLGGCSDAVVEDFLGHPRTVIVEHGDNAVIATASEGYVYLIDSIHVLRDDNGQPQVYDGTASGLLPTSAMNAVQVWWQERAESALIKSEAFTTES